MAPMSAATIHHVTLTVVDVGRSSNWYEDLLGRVETSTDIANVGE